MGRRRRVREMERRLAELDEWDRRYGLGGAPPGHPSARDTVPWRYHSPEGAPPVGAFRPVPVARPARRRRRRWPAVVMVLALVGGGVLALEHPERVREGVGQAVAAGRSVLGTTAPDRTAPDGPGAGLTDRIVDLARVPAPSGWAPASGDRVLPPVQVRDTGSHAFVARQPGTDLPVGFSPCEVVEVEVNPDRAPDGYVELVAGSLLRLTAASGLQLVLVGETTERWADRAREVGAPVLVSWADAEEVPELAGPVAGLGGALTLSGPSGVWAAGGRVVLDVDVDLLPEQQAALLDHELAHVLGLDHVDDPGELMAPTNVGVTSFGPGDLEGLARLGAIPCA